MLLITSNRTWLSYVHLARVGDSPPPGRIALLRPLLYSPGGSPLWTAGAFSCPAPKAQGCSYSERASLTSSSSRRDSFKKDACANGEGLSFALHSDYGFSPFG